jgi:hypothetical protein
MKIKTSLKAGTWTEGGTTMNDSAAAGGVKSGGPVGPGPGGTGG